ncbi:MAG TPA: TadE family protein [Ktedonobacterales bacterium]|nr:TadE family protein [Ktedonobacterales bacterium]
MESLERRTPGWPHGIRRRLERRRAQPRARSYGQALVEFALIAPLFLLLMFGVVEYSLINASIGAFNFAAKEGARNEAILGNGSPPQPYNNVPLDQYVVNNVILPHVSGVVMATMSEVIVYQSDETGQCYGGGTVPNCAHQDILQNVSGTWKTTSNTWTTARNTQLSNADYVGVYLAYSYTYLTAFFAVTSPTINLTATSVQRIEPQEYGYHKKDAPIAGVGTPWSLASFSYLLASHFSFAAIDPRRAQSYLAGECA